MQKKNKIKERQDENNYHVKYNYNFLLQLKQFPEFHAFLKTTELEAAFAAMCDIER